MGVSAFLGVGEISGVKNKARGERGRGGSLQDWVFFFKHFTGRERVRFARVIFFVFFVRWRFICLV